ncbi:polysaccharide pyruvyl transferase family protein [Enterococcus timonensis]|uniref:polysaccharide pyruvyl transferase family protein n=1 Tax=Enterococcus timonensis TaxID=1852364 RepID=UPI0008D9BCD0|nr:polysaccharide pyruvyl transferase family protein [Enterococcus timonensis]
MKKISVITLHAIKNYGSVLQTLATQEIFQNMNLEVEFVNYIRPDASDEAILDTWTKKEKGLIKLTKKIILLPTIKKWKTVFGGFLKSNINLSENTYSTTQDFLENPIVSDNYCVGSDQVWNSKWNLGLIPEFFLSYAPSGSNKISFASSFGKEKLDDWEKVETKNLLADFRHISVRENSAVDIINDLDIAGAVHVLDPTLVLDKDFWAKFAGESPKRKKYCLIYQLNSNSNFDKFTKEYARKNGLELLRICIRYDQFIKTGKPVFIPEVKEFVSLFLNASCVITDSFHATAFSINLNIPFISIYPGEFSTRIASILKVMHLENRHLEDYSKTIEINDIDFDYANKLLNKQRAETMEFLTTAINSED